MGLWAFLPFLWIESDSRKTAFVVSLSFYLAVSRGIVPGAYIFFRDGNTFQAFLLWIASAFALSLPWGIFWTPKNIPVTRKISQMLFSLLVSIPPPLGIICWTHPLMAAGFLFSGFGWMGLLLLIVLYSWAVVSRRVNRVIAIVFFVSLLFGDFSAENRSLAHLRVMEINTSFGRLASGSADFAEQFEREKKVFQYIRRMEDAEMMNADMIVLPETLIGRMNFTTQKRWERFFSHWTKNGIVFLVGAEIPTDEGRKYDNTVVVFDGSTHFQVAKQRVPVPYSMFCPFSATGANAYLGSLGEISILKVKSKKLGVLVCYEQFLMWPFLTLLTQKPDAIVAPANMWWSRDTSLPCIQRRTLHAWSALFNIPFYISIND
jgi:apolipoprotein N-acyltransferase